MSMSLEHTYQMRKTEFMAENESSDPDGVSLQLLQSTCLLTYPMNRNNVLEGNNLIYLNGAYITFYNFFQNNKHFGTVASSYRPVGMVGNCGGRGCVAIVTQNQDKTCMEISVYTFCEQYVPTHIIKKYLQFIDIVMLRSNYIVLAVHDDKCKQSYVYIFNSKTVLVITFSQHIKRLICQDSKIYVIFQQGGMYQLDTQKTIQKQDIVPEFPQKIIDDYCEVDNQTKIILYNQSILYCYWFETDKYYILDFSQYVQNCKGHRLIKIGRNILVAHRSSLIISHFIINDDSLHFVGNHAYPQRLKAGIVSVQSSQDQMHAALAVQIMERDQTKIQNFIFNLSSISKSHKFISPFTRVMRMGADCGTFNSMQNVLSSNAYLLIGSNVFNLFYSTTLERRKMFNLYEVPKFMTVHPLGYQFLCGFDNMIKFYNKVQKDMQQIWSEQYVCTAAKYSKSGGLVLSCMQESYTVLTVYDCYNFRKLHNIPISFMKICTTKIEWAHNNSAIVLYSAAEMIKINVFSGQKISEFRQRKDGIAIKCIQYDTFCDKVIAGTNSSSIVMATKSQSSGYSLNNMKVINFPEDVSCIKINFGLKAIFFGGKSGNLYWCNYPFKIKNATIQQGPSSFTIGQDIHKLKLHHMPITSIDTTNNNKFMLINIKSQGYFKCRVRKIRTKDTNGSINAVFQQLGNPILNTIDISSSSAYTANKQKLKIALEKRKQCFNDLQQFRREWQLKLALTSKKIQVSSKKNQLDFINQTLQRIQQMKQKKKDTQDSIDLIVKQTQEMKTIKQQLYVKNMLSLYEQSAKQSQILESKKNKFETQYNNLVKECEQNLTEISQDLQQKRHQFENNYKGMLQNLKKFKKRFQYEQQQQIEQRKLQISQILKNLQIQQIDLNKLSNDLSVKITQNKKQYQRYCNRKQFLEHKNIFFEQDNYNCKIEKSKLEELKDKLQKQLKELQIYTDKKQKKLKIYLQANESLRKYKEIHQSMKDNAHKQIQFIKKEKDKVDENIVQMQKQLSLIASSNEQADKQIDNLQRQLEAFKSKNKKISIKAKDIGFYLNQIVNAMQNVGFCKDQNIKSQKLKQIYNHFYVQRSVQKLIQNQTQNQVRPQQSVLNEKNQKLKIQQSKILKQLSNQKQYIESNMQIFKNYNKRVNQQINLNYLQIQAQNYNLIAQCNLRKEQAANKKRMLHQLIDSVKETQIYLDQMKNEAKQHLKFKNKQRKVIKTSNQVPFILYQREKQQKCHLQRVKSSEQSLVSSKIEYNPKQFTYFPGNFCPTINKISGSKYSAKRLLDIKGFGQFPQQKQVFRRIKTAVNKNKNIIQPQIDKEHYGIVKPLTATFKSRHQRQTLTSAISIKNKSSSKPSTCATNTRVKISVAL